MSQRVDERTPTKTELLVYDKALKLSDHVMSLCKPKDKNVNTHHIPKRNAGIGRMLMECAVELGADILEANRFYVAANAGSGTRLQNYIHRIELQDKAIRITYRMEHIFRILHFDREFAESTSKYFMDLLCETRELLVRWRDSDEKMMKTLLNSQG